MGNCDHKYAIDGRMLIKNLWNSDIEYVSCEKCGGRLGARTQITIRRLGRVIGACLVLLMYFVLNTLQVFTTAKGAIRIVALAIFAALACVALQMVLTWLSVLFVIKFSKSDMAHKREKR